MQPHKALCLEILNNFITGDFGFLVSLDFPSYGTGLSDSIAESRLSCNGQSKKNPKCFKRMWAKAQWVSAILI